jgi:hypothetical protein
MYLIDKFKLRKKPLHVYRKTIQLVQIMKCSSLGLVFYRHSLGLYGHDFHELGHVMLFSHSDIILVFCADIGVFLSGMTRMTLTDRDDSLISTCTGASKLKTTF